MTFRAILIDSAQSVGIEELADDQSPPGDVAVDVEHPTLNFKDALAITGTSPLAAGARCRRRQPLTRVATGFRNFMNWWR